MSDNTLFRHLAFSLWMSACFFVLGTGAAVANLHGVPEIPSLIFGALAAWAVGDFLWKQGKPLLDKYIPKT